MERVNEPCAAAAPSLDVRLAGSPVAPQTGLGAPLAGPLAGSPRDRDSLLDPLAASESQLAEQLFFGK